MAKIINPPSGKGGKGFQRGSNPPPDFKKVLQYFQGSLALVLVTFILVAIVMLMGIRFEEVEKAEVGILLNKINGKTEVVDQAGMVVFNGILKSFHTLDRTLQTLQMKGDDVLKCKTIDGSNVQLDLSIVFLIDKTQVEQVVKISGLDDAFKQKWIRDYGRSICRNNFGRLTTEQFYDAGQRGEVARRAMDELNRRLNPHGIIVQRIIPENFYFPEEYEAKIKEKKLADQTVEEQVSKARAAQQTMERMMVEAEKKKEVQLKTFEGEMRELIVDAEAEAKKIREEANAKAITTQIDAEATFYQMKQNAEATLVEQKAEAAGMAWMAGALQGPGGLNLIRMQYAGKLQMPITGQPFVLEGITERFQHSAAASPPAVRKAVESQQGASK